jgi:hypothetical protein
MNNDDEIVTVGLAFVLALVISFALMVPLMLWSAYVFTFLWAWFVVPVFGLPILSTLQSFGILLAAGSLKGKAAHEEKPLKFYARVTLGPLLALVTGYILKGFLV